MFFSVSRSPNFKDALSSFLTLPSHMQQSGRIWRNQGMRRRDVRDGPGIHHHQQQTACQEAGSGRSRRVCCWTLSGNVHVTHTTYTTHHVHHGGHWDTGRKSFTRFVAVFLDVFGIWIVFWELKLWRLRMWALVIPGIMEVYGTMDISLDLTSIKVHGTMELPITKFTRMDTSHFLSLFMSFPTSFLVFLGFL